MPSEDKDDKVYLQTFMGESKQEYRTFIYRFEAYEDSKKIRATTSVDRVGELPTNEQYWTGRKHTVVNGVDTDISLTNAEKKLYEENAKSRAKLVQYVHQTLLEPMIASGGDKGSVYLMKEWLKLNYAEVTAEDSLMELTEELKKLHPGDYKDALLYLGMIESLNAKLGSLDAGDKYKLDELQLKA